MKILRSWFLIFVFFAPAFCLAQETVTLHLTSKFELTTKDKADCHCTAVMNLDELKFVGPVQCKYPDSSPRLMVTYDNAGMKSGEAKLYQKNNISLLQGNYVAGNRTGLWKYYYANGSPKQTIEFYNDPVTRAFAANIMVKEYFTPNGKQEVVNGNGMWRNDSIQIIWANERIWASVKGDVKDGMKHGVWQCRRMGKTKLLQSEKFDQGRFLSGEVYMGPDPSKPGLMMQEMIKKFPDEYEFLFDNLESLKLDRTAYPDSVADFATEKFIEKVFGIKHQVRFRDAGYRFGERRLMQYIAKNIRYPAAARRSGLSGVVIVQLTITSDNRAKDFKVLKGEHDVLNDEALRVISSVDQWNAAIHEGKPYEKTIAIPVRFML